MIQVSFQVDEGILARFHQDSEGFTREFRLVAAVKWYELAQVSQGRAAEIAGVSRAEFIQALGQYGVSPFQQTAAGIVDDAEAAAGG